MSRKSEAIKNFIPVALKHYKQLFKSLMAFTEDNMAQDIVNSYTNGKGLPYVDLLEVVPGFNETVNDFTFLSYTSRVTDIGFIKAIAKSFDKCDYLEIGCFRGESLVNILPNTNSTVSLSLSKKEMREINLPEYLMEPESILVKPNEKLTQIYHNSLTFDFTSLNKKFDLIFIDGDHSTHAVKIDTANAFKLLKDENSIIIWHDFGNNYSEQRNDVIAGALMGAPKETHPFIYRVSNTLCGIYTKRPLKTMAPDANLVMPTKLFDVTVASKKI
ncbi:MAG: class I SAM-dependent methyltransferase [Chitinophagales bacterium]|nr:class I SAM-dependent methyltransferase [Chitinophagales bacterium]